MYVSQTMYTKLHGGVPHGVYSPGEDLVHDCRLCRHPRRVSSHHIPSFIYQPDFDTSVQFRGSELHRGCLRAKGGGFGVWGNGGGSVHDRAVCQP